MSEKWKKVATEHYKISDMKKCPDCGEPMLPCDPYDLCTTCKRFIPATTKTIPYKVEGGGDA